MQWRRKACLHFDFPSKAFARRPQNGGGGSSMGSHRRPYPRPVRRICAEGCRTRWPGTPAPESGRRSRPGSCGKSGLKSGPPVNRAITSKDIEYAFEGINIAPLVAQYGQYYFGTIKGMDGKAKSPQPISGIETPDDSTIIFHLTKPTGDFLYRVSMPATAPIPQEVGKCFTKAGDYGRFIISSGPYMLKGSDKLNISSCSAMKPISGFDPTKQLLLVRNPSYHQSSDDLRTNNVDGIQVSIDTNVNDIFNKVESGSLDASFTSQPPKPILQQYLTQPDKKNLIHFDSGDRTWYITMNWTTPPFDDIHVRKAANLIMDKAAMLQAWGGPSFGQSKYDSNKDGICDAPACSNLVMINRNVAPWTDLEPVVVNSLGKIGIKVKPRELAASAAYTTIQTVRNNIPIALNAGWGKDYADPYTFAGPLFAGTSIIPTDNTNYALVGLTPSEASAVGARIPAGVNIPNVDTDINDCEKIPATDPSRTTCWTNLDRKVMETAVPWVPYLWADNPTVANPSLTHYEFDQFSGYISPTEIAVNNKINASTLS